MRASRKPWSAVRVVGYRVHVVSAPDPTPALWPFAVHAYALPGVAAQCLRLQDEHGLDVDVLLAILWHASRRATLDDAALDRLLGAAATARARVLELRALRRTLGDDRAQDPRWQETYEHVKAAELAAERVQLSCLEQTLSAPPGPASAPSEAPATPTTLALAALARYAERCGAASCEPLLRELALAVLPRPSPARG
jgi:uncharacterized protein (TIGR02444 family)